MSPDEREQLVDLIAQAVIDKIEERSKINMLAEMVMQRVLALQREEATLNYGVDNTMETHLQQGV